MRLPVGVGARGLRGAGIETGKGGEGGRVREDGKKKKGENTPPRRGGVERGGVGGQ